MINNNLNIAAFLYRIQMFLLENILKLYIQCGLINSNKRVLQLKPFNFVPLANSILNETFLLNFTVIF